MDGSLGGHDEVLRGSRGEAAGTKPGSSSVERITVNTGTAPILPDPAPPTWTSGLGPPSAEQIGTGRSRRLSRDSWNLRWRSPA